MEAAHMSFMAPPSDYKTSAKLESIISMDYLSRDIRLVGSLSQDGSITLSSLHSLFWYNTETSVDDLLTACSMSAILSKCLVFTPEPGIAPPYRIQLSKLVLSDLPPDATNEEFSNFIKMLVGIISFKLSPIENGSTTLIFHNKSNALAVWRALTVIPFHGTNINAHIFAREHPPDEPHIVPFLPRTKPRNKKNSRGKNKRQDTEKTDDSFSNFASKEVSHALKLGAAE